MAAAARERVTRARVPAPHDPEGVGGNARASRAWKGNGCRVVSRLFPFQQKKSRFLDFVESFASERFNSARNDIPMREEPQAKS